MTTLTATATSPAPLPDRLPVFPLPGAVLFPRARLPLHIFEPRYLAMIDDVLATPGRMLGMIQPTEDEDKRPVASPPALYTIGCAGRISSFAETDDGRLMIALTGICRFEIGAEMNLTQPYRTVRPIWDKFLHDMEEPQPDEEIDHARLATALKPYLKSQNIEADWAAIESMDDESLVSTLIMVCPLAPNEKQALLEAPDLQERTTMLLTLLEMAAMPPVDGNARH